MDTLYYYTVEFQYRGPYCGPDPEASPDACEALDSAETLVEQTLNRLKVEWVHQYSWPDGSMYKMVRSKHSADVIKTAIDFRLEEQGHQVKVMSVHLVPDSDPSQEWNHSQEVKNRFAQAPPEDQIQTYHRAKP